MRRNAAALAALALGVTACKLGGGNDDKHGKGAPPRLAGPTSTATGTGATRDVSFQVEVRLRREGAAGEGGSSDVSALFATRCVSCHADPASLDLRALPLASRFATQEQAVDEILRRVRDTTRPMPPLPETRLSDGEIAKLQDWRDHGLRDESREAPPSTLANAMVVKLTWLDQSASWPWNGNGNFAGQASGLSIGASVDFTLAALGEDGQAAAQKAFPKMEIGATGDLEFTLEVDEAALKGHAADSVAATPGDGGAVRVLDVRADSFSVSFAPASDNVTVAGDLKYAVFVSESREAVADPAQAGSRARLAHDWSAARPSVTITGLTPGKTYYVLVAVRDGRGNVSAYQLVEQKTVNDPVPPAVADTRVTVAEVTDGTAVVSWTRANDDAAAQSAIRYQVVTVNGSDEVAVGEPMRDKVSLKLAGLLPQTSYTVNVQALDEAGNKTAYVAASFTTGAGSGSLTHAAYGGQCAKRLGRLKPMNCLDGEIIPITVEGTAIATDLTAAQAGAYRFGEDENQQTCDKPALLQLGQQGQCIPYARIMRVDSYRPDGSKHPDVDSLLLCRRYTARLGRHTWRGQTYDGAKYPGFEDIAIIQHNRVTGETCWFQALAPLGEAKDARRVPPPDEGALPAGTPAYAESAAKFWLSPTETARRDCVMCHDADPWMHSPYVDQVRLASGAPLVYGGTKTTGRSGRYSMLGNRHFPGWTMPLGIAAAPLASGKTCTSCHEMGNRESCVRWIQQSVGKSLAPNVSRRGRSDFHLSHWMPPPAEAGANQAAWDQAGWGEAADRLLACCARPTSQGCTSKPLITPPPPYPGE